MFKRILRSKTLQARARWILAVILVPPFILFFHMWVGNRPGPGAGGTAGLIFGHPVPWETYQQEYQFLRRAMQGQLGTAVPEAMEPMVRQQTWDRLILLEEARRTVRVSDAELAKYLQSEPTFQQDGRFVPELYFRVVRGMGMTPQVFEERMRDDLRIQRLADAVKAKVSITEEDVKSTYAKEHAPMRAALIVVTFTDLEAQLRPTLTEPALRAYYDAHHDAVEHPAKRTIAYLGMSASEALDALPPLTEEEVQRYYDEHTDAFKQGDGSVQPLERVHDEVRRRARDEQVRRRLKDVALDLQDDADQKRGFEAMAASRPLKVRTIGPVEQSASGVPNGPTGVMIRAAFEVSVGQMTEVFETPMGVFVLTPTEEVPATLPPFAEVRTKIEQMLLQEKTREAAKARATQLRQELLALRQRGLTFEEACAPLRLTPFRPAPFIRNESVQSFGDVPTLTQALAELTPGELSEVLPTPQGFVIGVVEERLPIDEERFAKEKASFKQTVLSAKQNAEFGRWFDVLRTQARLKSYLEQPAP